LVSRGAQSALLLSQKSRIHFIARPPRVVVRNTVGAGDALLAAVAIQIQRGASPAEWLRLGVAAGVAATQVSAGQLPARALVQRMSKRIRFD
jgi:fructose-1-phosphate kinase PfkB-like protein